MARRSELMEQIVAAVGWEPARALVRELGGLQILVPGGTGTVGAMHARLEEILGADGCAAFCRVFGHTKMTVPKCQAQLLAARNAAIVADYDGGASMLELVQKFRLSERQIRAILNSPVGSADGFSAVPDWQMSLF